MTTKGSGILLILAGVAVVLAGATVSTLMFDQIEVFVDETFGDVPTWVDWVFAVLTFFVSLGGLGLIAAGVLALLDLRGPARWVTLFAVIGLLTGAVVQAIVLVGQGEGEGGWWIDVAFWIGLLAGLVGLRARSSLTA